MIRTMLSVLAARTKKFLQTSPQAAARKSPTKLSVEQLGERIVPHSQFTVETPVGVATFSTFQGTASLGTFNQNDVIELSANLLARDGSGSADLIVFVSGARADGTDGALGLRAIVGQGEASDTGQYIVTGTGPVSLSFSILKSLGVADEQYGGIRVTRIQRVPDIVPIGIGLHLDNRTVNFDIDVRNAALPAGVKVPVKYYWVNEGNVGQEIILPEEEPAKYLSNIGKDQRVTLAVPFKYFANNPDWTSRIRIDINPDKTVQESSYKNSLNYRPANIVPLAPRLNDKGQFEIGYRVENEHFFNANDELKNEAVTVQAWWSKDGTWAGKIGNEAVFRVAMQPQKGGDKYVRPSAADLEKLKNPPAGAKFIITRVDNANVVPESNEKDNNSPGFALFDANVKSLTWDGNGGAKFTVTLANRDHLPEKSNLRVEFYWYSDKIVDGRTVGKMSATPLYTFPISLAPGRTFRDGDNSWTVDAKNLPSPTPSQIVAFRHTVSHLVAVVKQDGGPATAASRPSEFKLRLAEVSLELFDAPAAATPKERVGLWLKKHAAEIKAAAQQFRIDPRAVAGVIAWEASINPGNFLFNGVRTVEDYLNPISSLSRAANSPGKIHADPDKILANVPGEPHPTIVEEIEQLGLVPAQATTADRLRVLEHPRTGINTSIRYIAAIMGAYADAFEQIHPMKPIRNKPDELATLYNGVEKWPNLTSVYETLPLLPEDYEPKPHDPPAPGKAPFAGNWVKTNITYLDNALGGRPKPVRTPPRYEPVYVERDVPWGSTLTIPAAELLGPGAERVVGFAPHPFGPGSGQARVVGNNVIVTDAPNIADPVSYYFSVWANGRVVYGGQLAVNITPPVPDEVQASATSSATIQLSWRALSKANTVVVEKAVAGNWQTVATIEGAQSTWVGSGHSPSTEYQYRLRAMDGRGRSSLPTAAVRVRTPDGRTAAPANLRVVSVEPRNVNLRWDEVQGENHYVVEVSTDGGGSWRLQENVPADHAYGATFTVQPDRSYVFRVVAVNANGRSAPSNTVPVKTPEDPRPAPTLPAGLVLENVWPRRSDVRWQAGSGAISTYRIAVSRDGGATWDNVGEVPADRTSFRVEGLTPNSRTLVKVRASGPGGFSDYTNTIAVVTPR